MYTSRNGRGAFRLAATLSLAIAGVLLSRPVQADSAAVAIANFAFAPGTITVPVGSTVTWTNGDSYAHTTTSDPTSAVSWDSGAMNPGATYRVTFTRTGTFTYHCAIHSYMTGTIVVQGSVPSATDTPILTAVPAATNTPTATVSPSVASSPTASPSPTSTSIPSATTTSTAVVKKPGTRTVAAKPKGQTFAFSPVSVTIKVGTTVTWVNRSEAPHTVSSKSKGWKFNKGLDKAAVSFTFKKIGTYVYHCRFHPGMNGKIVVRR